MNNPHHKKFLVATDLDGTLLDHDNYSWQAAKTSIEQLQVGGSMIVINTSKTLAEVHALQQELNLDAPFIVENGSAIYAPVTSSTARFLKPYNNEFSRLVLGTEATAITYLLNQLRTQHNWQFEGFSDWSVTEVMQHTGLAQDKAALAKERQFSEPILWQDSEENFSAFANELSKHQLKTLRGGRFIHVLGKSDKGTALLALRQQLPDYSNTPLICLGDSYNDLDMLQIADYPVFVRSPAHDFPAHQCAVPPIYTTAYGPVGWHEAIQKILQ
ncbi:HAD-IIB family hydrolase [Cellvibrio sp. OA-2007]|uniref:HAD-IIB family hydrolase n=1 Tax=Cellvibrio sp. OA-2007 TaxID=529823 RepID=UPI0007837808|nr:HAD-IIB family hydrolase [Cellvibrio sp. OA-2007]